MIPGPTATPATRHRHTVRQWLDYLRYQARGFIRCIQLDFFPARRVFREATCSTLQADARAGLNVGLLAFPQSIAYSLIAGLPPQFGLCSSGVGAIVGPLFSGSRFIVFGPTNATAILLFSGMTAAGIAEDNRVAVLPLFVLMVGAFQLLGSLLKVSQLLTYISRTVVTGYLTAAAALIVANQIQNALGFNVSGASTFFAVVAGTLRKLSDTRGPELLMSVTTLACYLAITRFAPRLPNVASTLVLMALLALGFEWLGWPLAYLAGFSLHHVNLFGVHMNFELIGQLASPALAIAFVGILEGSSVGKSLASRSGERLNVNQELYGMGMANVASAFFGGMAGSGSLTRSTLNWSSGARTALGTVASGVVVLLLLFSLGFLVGAIPKAALAVVVVCIGCSLFNSHRIRMALRTTRSDATVFAVTCGSALLFNLDSAIYLGAFTSVFLFLRKAGVPELVEYNFNPQGQLAELPDKAHRHAPGISILHAEGDLFFASTDIFVQQIREVIKDPNLKVIILRLKNARHLDATCVLAIEELLDFLRSGGRHLLVSGADTEILRVFRNSGLLQKLGLENFFPEVAGNPTVSTRNALKRAQQLLGPHKPELRIFVDQIRDSHTQPAAS